MSAMTSASTRARLSLRKVLRGSHSSLANPTGIPKKLVGAIVVIDMYSDHYTELQEKFYIEKVIDMESSYAKP